MTEIRLATADDFKSIAEWTKDTFVWGDYVRHRFHTWLEEKDTSVFVCVDSSDEPIALANAVQMSEREAWMEAARVHPDHRRQGLGTALNHAGVEWAAERGCQVIRLATETTNEPAVRQVKALGYRSIGRWFYAEVSVDGQQHSEEQFRLRPATSTDAEASWMAWAPSDLARDAREMIARGWRWRRSRPDDPIEAAQEGRLLQSAAGWASIREHAEWLAVEWMVTTPEDILALIDGLLEATSARQLPELNFKLPDVGWTREAAKRVGATTFGQTLWAKPI